MILMHSDTRKLNILQNTYWPENDAVANLKNVVLKYNNFSLNKFSSEN